MENSFDVIIIGAGLSGLSTAHFLHKATQDLSVKIVEKSQRSGGAVQTFNQSGFQGEWGPHGFLDNTPESQELLRDLGLYQEAQPAPLEDFYRYLCHNGKLQRLPQSPKTILTTPLLTFPGKLRALADLFKKPIDLDQSIGEWVEYRFGRQLLPLVDAAVTGSFAGDYTRLSIDAVMPGVRQLEKEVGSVIRGLIRKKKSGKQKKLSRLPSMLNFPHGMEYLIKTMTTGRDIEYNQKVLSVSKDEQWQVQTDSQKLSAANLVIALPVNKALELLTSISAPPVPKVSVARIVNVVLGFDKSAKVPYGFGYLAPENEKRFALGAMFTSHMFPDRSPQDQVMIEALVGGLRHPERLQLSDDELIKNVLQDISKLMELPPTPLFTKVLRPENGIPQMEMNHPALLDWRNTIEGNQAGLQVCGFGWDGIGMNDMIKTARKTANAIVKGGRRELAAAKVKPIYF